MQEKSKSKQRKKTPKAQDRLTLEEYMETYKIRKKIEQRNRSKSKGREQSFQKQYQRNEKNIYLKFDKYLEQAKIELSQNINNLQVSRQRIFFYISKILDKLIMDLKGQISKLYKDVYNNYKVSLQKLPNKDQNQVDNFFKQNTNLSKQEMIKAHKVDAIKEQIKIQNKNTQILKNLLQIVKQNKQYQLSGQPQKQQQKQNKQKTSGIMDLFQILIPIEQKSTAYKDQKQNRPIVKKNTISSSKTKSEINRIPAFQRKPQAGFRAFSKLKR